LSHYSALDRLKCGNTERVLDQHAFRRNILLDLFCFGVS
jgi:hypothetical protein